MGLDLEGGVREHQEEKSVEKGRKKGDLISNRNSSSLSKHPLFSLNLEAASKTS